MSEEANKKDNEELNTEEAAKKEMYKFLNETFGDSAPDEEKVEGWKRKFRRVRILPMSEKEVYFIRPIKRSEYKILVDSAKTAGGEDPDLFLRESIVSKCVLWPLMDTAQFSDSYAGTVDAVYNVIMDASNFVSQEALFNIVREL